MDIEKEKYSINEISDMLDINSSTLRNYEKEFNLIIPRDNRNRRYYTDKEIEILKIIKEARKENHSIDTIRKSLEKHDFIESQQENGINLMPMDKLTPEQLNQVQEQMFNKFSEQLAELVITREAEMQQKYEEKLSKELSDLKDSLKDQLQLELKNHQEQLKGENEKLINYIEKSRESDKKKSFFSKLFNK